MKLPLAIILSSSLFFTNCNCDDQQTQSVENAENNDTTTQLNGSCDTDADCSYNGSCEEEECNCFSPWFGEGCNELTLGVVDKSDYGYREGFPYTTSWGGSVQYDEETEQYIMLVSEYIEECENWAANSTVVIATSTNPEGPYEKQYRLFGAMSHEAMFARAPTGEWVVYFTAKEQDNGLPLDGNGIPAADTICTRDDYESPCNCGENASSYSNDPTWMSYTATPLEYDSWSTPEKIFDPGQHFTDTVPGGDRAESIDANFNGVILNDGSFVGLWRTWQNGGDLVPPWSERLEGIEDEEAFSVPHAIKVNDWKNTASYADEISESKSDLDWLFDEEYYVAPEIHLTGGIEDPMVYIDARSPNVYHAIFHEMFNPQDNVSHAYSTDGTNWTYTGPVFSLEENMPLVEFTDGTQAGLACERPQLILKDGIPTHIIIGGIPTGLGNDPDYPEEGLEDVTDQASTFGWPGGATMVIPLVTP